MPQSTPQIVILNADDCDNCMHPDEDIIIMGVDQCTTCERCKLDYNIKLNLGKKSQCDCVKVRSRTNKHICGLCGKHMIRCQTIDIICACGQIAKENATHIYAAKCKKCAFHDRDDRFAADEAVCCENCGKEYYHPRHDYEYHENIIKQCAECPIDNKWLKCRFGPPGWLIYRYYTNQGGHKWLKPEGPIDKDYKCCDRCNPGCRNSGNFVKESIEYLQQYELTGEIKHFFVRHKKDSKIIPFSCASCLAHHNQSHCQYLSPLQQSA